ncbi:hypothetical protein F5Y07DRAFT_279687 [Xylaria sp. FL0933]|nr:hypothetical protein F5Y07DRAFT_279687 [Xylaria sp. FL0933]
MDPLSTIGLLGDVVQFIDFAAKLLAKSRELYNSSDGHFIETSELIKISEHTSQLSQNLVNRPNSTPSNEFATLIEGCHDVSGELLRALGQLKVQGRKSGYKTFRQAFKTIWSKEKIRELEARLDRFRREINLHICVQLR